MGAEKAEFTQLKAKGFKTASGRGDGRWREIRKKPKKVEAAMLNS